MSAVRSNELETGLSSSDDLIEVEEDTATYSPREAWTFHAFEEVCRLDFDTLSRFRNRFQFLERVWIRLPYGKEWAYHFLPGEVCFYEATF